MKTSPSKLRKGSVQVQKETQKGGYPGPRSLKYSEFDDFTCCCAEEGKEMYKDVKYTWELLFCSFCFLFLLNNVPVAVAFVVFLRSLLFLITGKLVINCWKLLCNIVVITSRWRKETHLKKPQIAMFVHKINHGYPYVWRRFWFTRKKNSN